MTATLVPSHIRPINFAIVEMLLDLIHIGRTVFSVDHESFVILLCVSDATMRPLMTDPSTPPDAIRALRPPDHLRGSISRRMIADKTGLPRETVRRKISALADASFVTIDSKQRIRIAQTLDDPRSTSAIEAGHRAVLRYLARLRELGVDPDRLNL